MDIVLDYNIVFSALQGGRYAIELFSTNYVKGTYRFLVPEFFYREFQKHLNKLQALTKLSSDDFRTVMEVILDQLVDVSDDVVKTAVDDARTITPDPKDAPYVALALALDVPLLTGDRKLIEAVRGR